MTIRVPNPCDGVVEPVEEPQVEEEAQGEQGLVLDSPEVQEPIFSERVFDAEDFMAFKAERTITMVDEEFMVGQFSYLYPAGVDQANPQLSMLTPAWFYDLKESNQILLTGPTEGEMDTGKIDPFRAGLMLTWYWENSSDFQGATFTNPIKFPPSAEMAGRRTMYNIPIMVTPNTDRQNDDTLAIESRIDLHIDAFRARQLTNEFADFQDARNPSDNFMHVYFYGENSDLYESLPSDAAKTKFKYGLIPRPKTTFQDSVFESPLPYHKEEADLMNIPTFNVVDISLESRGFETEGFGTGKIISEYQKPSIYRSFFEEKGLENLELNAIMANEGPRCIPADKVQKFPSDKVEMMETANAKLEDQSESFIRVKIATRQGGDNFIAQLLRDNKMDRHLLDLLTSDVDNQRYSPDPEVFTQIMKDKVFAGRVGDTAADVTTVDMFTSNDQSKRGVFFDANNRFEVKINDQSTFSTREQDISQYPMAYHNYDKPVLLSFEDAITSQIFLSELKEHVRTRKLNRSFIEIMGGKKAHAEIVAYHVEKSDAVTGEVIQDFYFSDSNEVLEIDFVDNQIIKGKKYRYRVYAVNMVISTKYRYDNLRRNRRPGSGTYHLHVNARPEYAIIETPYFEKIVSVFDKPPMFPQVSFVPYQGIEDQIGFLLQDNGGEILELPIPIRKEDQESILKMSEAQDKVVGDKLLYGSDDLPTGFEALCLTEQALFESFERNEPLSYEDFSVAEPKRFDAHGKTGFFKMDIEPNRYYYIIFRTVEDDMLSNPTEVFRFMMVSYENGIFLDVQTIELNPPSAAKPMTFERVLKFEPNLMHYLLNIAPASESAQDMTNFVKSAPEITEDNVGKLEDELQESLWGKKLKVRLRSKSTSKELDINVVFEKSIITHLPGNPDSVEPVVPTVCEDEPE